MKKEAVMAKIELYLHLKGRRQTPEKSEYQIINDIKPSVIALKNAKLIDDIFLQVQNERKSVYLVVCSKTNQESLYPIIKLNHHCSSTELRKKENFIVEGKKVYSSDAGVLFVHGRYTKQFREHYSRVRRGNKSYFVGGSSAHDYYSQNGGRLPKISFDRFLEYLAGEIGFEDI
jgi:hypothetical protein